MMWTLAYAKTDFSNKDFNYLEVKQNFFKNDDNKDFRLVEKLTKGEADLNQFMQLRSQLVIAAEYSGREENLSPVLIPR